jgi:hypothetical protein
MDDGMPLTFDTDGDGIADQYGFDTSGDGVVDSWAFDLDQDGWADGVATDLDGDGCADVWGTDPDQDGVLDDRFVDTTGDGHPDTAIGVSADATPTVVIGGHDPGPPRPPGADADLDVLLPGGGIDRAGEQAGPVTDLATRVVLDDMSTWPDLSADVR